MNACGNVKTCQARIRFPELTPQRLKQHTQHMGFKRYRILWLILSHACNAYPVDCGHCSETALCCKSPLCILVQLRFSFWNNLDVANSAWCRAGSISVRLFVMCVGCNQFFYFFSLWFFPIHNFCCCAANRHCFWTLSISKAATNHGSDSLGYPRKFEPLNMFESFSFYRCVLI